MKSQGKQHELFPSRVTQGIVPPGAAHNNLCEMLSFREAHLSPVAIIFEGQVMQAQSPYITLVAHSKIQVSVINYVC